MFTRPKKSSWAALVIAWICLASGVVIANPEAEPAPPAPGTSSLEADAAESKEVLTRFDLLHRQRLEALQESAALESEAKTSIGDDRLALQSQALELRLVGTTTLLEMMSLIDEMEARQEDASAQRRIAQSLMPAVEASIRADYRKQSAELVRLKTERADLSEAAEIARADVAIARQQDLLTRMLASGIDFLELEEAFGLPTQDLRSGLGDLVLARVRLAASHISLATRRLEDVVDHGLGGQEPEARKTAEAQASQRLSAASKRLQSSVELMERLELDSTDYRQILITSTGELTVEAIDTRVAGELISRWASQIRESLVANGPNLLFRTLLFVLIASIFWTLSRFVRKVVARAVQAPNLRFSELLKRMIVSLSAGLVLLLGLLIALSQLGIEVGPMLAGLGIAGFVLGFALQDTLGNFASGVMILIYRPFDVGDLIDCAGGVFGEVSQMSLVSTTILTIDNKTLIVPNSKIWGDVITNVTAQAVRRVDLEFGIGYGDDIPKTEAVLNEILADHPKILTHPEPMVKVHSLGDSSVNFVVRPWVARDDYWDIYWDVTREVKLRFDREGISIPFPQRDVHLSPAEPAPDGN
jgi:small conductance mechanosensitive channel